MSLINQVLNDLEKRGAGLPVATTSIRAVPTQPKWIKLIALGGGGLALVAIVFGVLWNVLHSTSGSVSPAVVAQQASPLVTIQPVVSQPAAASQPQPAAATSAVPETTESVAPASRLSFELASIPLPSSLRNNSLGNKQEEDASIKHAQPARAAKKKTVARPEPTMESAYKEGSPIKRVSPQQQAEDEFNQALALIQQGRKSEAQSHLETTLQLNPAQAQARQALVGLLLENKRNADAGRVLQDGLRHDPKQVGFAMLLARLQVERGTLPQALETLQKTLPYAEQQADYQAFMAAVLQRQNRHDEAIEHFQAALRQSPSSGVWLMGLGISLQALKRNEEARDAFRRALESHSLNAELQDFVGRRMKEL